MIIDLKKSVEKEFERLSDECGTLESLEIFNNAPFEIKRVYYIDNFKMKLARGFYAHKHLQQILICVRGSCEVILNDGKEKRRYQLNNHHKDLYIDKLIWFEIHDFSDDCVLMMLASEDFVEEDYIRNYDDFVYETVNISFVPYDSIFLQLSKKWLSDAEIKGLTMTPDFDDEIQIKWFNSLQDRDDYYIRGIQYKLEEIGALGIKNIHDKCGELWCYIGEKQYWGKGLAYYIVDHAIRTARMLELDYLYLKIDVNNKMSYRAAKKNNFKTLFEDNQKIYMIRYIC